MSTSTITIQRSVDKALLYHAVLAGIESGPFASFRVEGDWQAAWEAADRGEDEAFAKIILHDLAAEQEGCQPESPPTALTDERLVAGFKLLCDRTPSIAERVADDDADALDGDAFLQLAIHGAVIYG